MNEGKTQSSKTVSKGGSNQTEKRILEHLTGGEAVINGETFSDVDLVITDVHDEETGDVLDDEISISILPEDGAESATMIVERPAWIDLSQ
jgi:hypothetical protein